MGTPAKKATPPPDPPAPVDPPRPYEVVDYGPRTPSERAAEREQLRTAGQPTTAEEIIAARSADNPATEDTRFRKTFVMQTRAWEETGDHGDMHEANKVGVLQEALNLGLHPQEEATFDGSEELPGKSTALHYSVEVIPAALDEKAADAVTPSSALKNMPGGTTAQSQVREERKS